jgi:hypothetical protein
MWTATKPLEKWTSKELYAFLREVWYRPKSNSFTWDPPNIPANSTVDTSLDTSTTPEVEGLRAGQPVSVSPPSTIDGGLMWGAYVAADDTLTIRLGNLTGGAINPVSGTWSFSGMVL